MTIDLVDVVVVIIATAAVIITTRNARRLTPPPVRPKRAGLTPDSHPAASYRPPDAPPLIVISDVTVERWRHVPMVWRWSFTWSWINDHGVEPFTIQGHTLGRRSRALEIGYGYRDGMTANHPDPAG